jgi:phage terminase Nu1 subunit (DNA packaging protein)
VEFSIIQSFRETESSTTESLTQSPAKPPDTDAQLARLQTVVSLLKAKWMEQRRVFLQVLANLSAQPVRVRDTFTSEVPGMDEFNFPKVFQEVDYLKSIHDLLGV